MPEAFPPNPQGNKIIVCNFVFTVTAIALVGLRVLAKYVKARRYEVHDILSLASLLFVIGFAINAYFGVTCGGWGLHIQQVPLSHIQDVFKTFFAHELLYVFATTLVRLSLLTLYIQIFQKPRFIWAARGVGIVTIIFWAVGILTSCLSCRPIAFMWDKSIPGGQCGSVQAIVLYSAAANLALDLSLLILPVPIVCNLQIPLKKKIVYVGLFSIGLGNLGVNVARINQTVNSSSRDITYFAIEGDILSMAEIWTGLVVSCVPTLAPLFSADSLKVLSSLITGRFQSQQPREKDLESGPEKQFQHCPDSRWTKELRAIEDSDLETLAVSLPTLKSLPVLDKSLPPTPSGLVVQRGAGSVGEAEVDDGTTLASRASGDGDGPRDSRVITSRYASPGWYAERNMIPIFIRVDIDVYESPLQTKGWDR